MARLRHATYDRRGPVVLIDAAHYNVHTAENRYKPFAELMASDGFRIGACSRSFSDVTLSGAQVLVVANALGLRGVMQHLANLIGLERRVHFHPDAFSTGEVEAVKAWVSGGGSLLLVSDHAPCGAAAARLAQAFGVGMTDTWAEDPREHDPESGNPAFLLFTRDNGLLGEHAITSGRDPTERVRRVLTFTGQALTAPAGSSVLLRLSSGAREYPYAESSESEGRSAAGKAQGVALEFGQGRVVVLGEAAMITAQAAQASGRRLLFGMNRPGYDNRQFALNTMHWLARLY